VPPCQLKPACGCHIQGKERSSGHARCQGERSKTQGEKGILPLVLLRQVEERLSVSPLQICQLRSFPEGEYCLYQSKPLASYLHLTPSETK